LTALFWLSNRGEAESVHREILSQFNVLWRITAPAPQPSMLQTGHNDRFSSYLALLQRFLGFFAPAGFASSRSALSAAKG
jgi:hypothetical protein